MVQREKEKNKNGVEKNPMFITFKIAIVFKSQRLVTQHTILLILNFLSQLLVKNLKEHHSIHTSDQNTTTASGKLKFPFLSLNIAHKVPICYSSYL